MKPAPFRHFRPVDTLRLILSETDGSAAEALKRLIAVCVLCWIALPSGSPDYPQTPTLYVFHSAGVLLLWIALAFKELDDSIG